MDFSSATWRKRCLLILSFAKFCVRGSSRLEHFSLFLFRTFLHVLHLRWTCRVDMLVTVNKSFYCSASTVYLIITKLKGCFYFSPQRVSLFTNRTSRMVNLVKWTHLLTCRASLWTSACNTGTSHTITSSSQDNSAYVQQIKKKTSIQISIKLKFPALLCEILPFNSSLLPFQSG